MKLMTKAIEKAIPAIGKQDGAKNPKVYLKLFNPCGRYTYYATEYEPETGLLFGYAVSNARPEESEFGYASLPEMAAVRLPFGLGIERDMHFTAKGLVEALRDDRFEEEAKSVECILANR